MTLTPLRALISVGLLLLGSQEAIRPLAAEDDALAEKRAEMVGRIEFQMAMAGRETGFEALDKRIAEAMRTVPRHAFVPELLQPFAYDDGPLPIGYEQNISSPFLVALMTQLADVDSDDIVFETGTGAGYQAAVLSLLVAEVYSVEVVEPLAEEVRTTFKRLGYTNLQAKQGDGYYGWPAFAPYDAIIVKEAVDHVPTPLLKQLKVGGKMVIPLGPAGGPQVLTVVEKRADGRISRRPILPVIFSPLQGGERT